MGSIETVTMMDTIHANVDSIPVSTLYVGGYVSGSSDILWTPGDWERFPESERNRIYQGNGPVPVPHAFDTIDVESGAVTPALAAEIHRTRVISGVQWTTIYADESNAVATTNLIKAMGDSIWIGHVNVWLANWNLDEAEAAAVVGTEVGGATCIAVQWASPSSNPNTLIPGTDVTLAKGNVDLSVVDKYWTPSGGFTIQPIKPPPPGTPQQQAVLVTLPSGVVKRVVSTNGGYTWQ